MAASFVTTARLLIRREDIWKNFPVNVKPLGRGANGADRHGIEWHNANLRNYAIDRRLPTDIQTINELKDYFYPYVMDALRRSPSWSVESMSPDSGFFAIITMRFHKKINNNTTLRRNTKSLGNNTRRNIKYVEPFGNTMRHTIKNAESVRNNKTRRNNVAMTRLKPVEKGKEEGDELISKARAIINKLSEEKLEKLTNDLLALVPKNSRDFDKLISLMVEMMLEQQSYHPLIIYILHAMDKKHISLPYHELPSAAIGKKCLERFEKEPIFVKMEIDAENGTLNMNNKFENTVAKERSYYKSCMLFIGFLYRESLLDFTQLQHIIQRLKTLELSTDDYRMQDACVYGLIYIVIRAGKRMKVEGGDANKELATLREYFTQIPTRIRRGPVQALSRELLESMNKNYTIKANTPWTIGAPKSNVRKPIISATASAVAAEKLGANIGELWRRFPLDVKKEGDFYVVRFHNKKLQARYNNRESMHFRTIGDLQTSLYQHISRIVDASEYWQRGPMIPGSVLTIIPKK